MKWLALPFFAVAMFLIYRAYTPELTDLEGPLKLAGENEPQIVVRDGSTPEITSYTSIHGYSRHNRISTTRNTSGYVERPANPSMTRYASPDYNFQRSRNVR